MSVPTITEGTGQIMCSTKRRLRRMLARAVAAAGGTLAAALVLSAPAQAQFGIEPGSFRVGAYALEPDGRGGEQRVEITQAGAHPPYFRVAFRLRTRENQNGALAPEGSLKDVRIALPPGMTGNPLATPRCSMSDFRRNACPRLSMVGYHLLTYNPGAGSILPPPFASPVYNIVPPEGSVAQFAFTVATVTIVLDMRIRSDGRYDLVTDLSNISQALQIIGSELVLFGVPADLQAPGRYSDGAVSWGSPSGAPRIPLLTLGSACGPQPPATIRASTWHVPGLWVEDAFATSPPTGCEAQSFDGTLDVRPESPRAGTPSAYHVTLDIPQNDNASALGTPPLRTASVTLPDGVVVSPSNADGLVGCTDEQVALRSEHAPACPDASRIGSVTIDTPVLSEQLTGGVFLGQPKSMRSQTGEMLRIFLVASGQGVTIKQEGRITPDPVSGQLRAVFSTTPQLPFSRLAIRFDGGPRAPLTNPRACGTHTTTAQLTSWSGQTRTTSSSFAITEGATGGPCGPLGFAPSFIAGMANPAAGASSTFTLAFGRDDAQQDLGDLTADLPAGLMGMVSQAVLCDDADAAAGTCGEGSRIGTVTAAAGPGTNPLQLPGRGVFLTGPYKGGPFGLSIVVPAIAGPFDLGTVVVRAAIHVDRRTAALRVVSDPMPTILEGIPLRIRRVTVAIDKPGFMINPTSCAEKQIGGTLRSAAGATAAVSARFQTADCRSLPFRPRFALRVGGRGRTRRNVTTPLTATLRMTPGQANNRVVRVNLPRTMNARLNVINDACTLEQFRSDACDKRVGSAVAVTPVLRNPLRGEAYFVRNPERRLPDLMVALRGAGREAGVAIDLTGKVSVPRNLTLTTAFDTIPDVPITMFRLRIAPGRRGPVGNVHDLCLASTRRRSIARVGFRAQSGRLVQRRLRLRIAGCASASRRDARR